MKASERASPLKSSTLSLPNFQPTSSPTNQPTNHRDDDEYDEDFDDEVKKVFQNRLKLDMINNGLSS